MISADRQGITCGVLYVFSHHEIHSVYLYNDGRYDQIAEIFPGDVVMIVGNMDHHGYECIKFGFARGICAVNNKWFHANMAKVNS
jgi:hypothetical protein